MGLAGLGMEPFADDGAILNDDAADHRIGASASDRCPGELDAPPHETRIIRHLATNADKTPGIAGGDLGAGGPCAGIDGNERLGFGVEEREKGSDGVRWACQGIRHCCSAKRNTKTK